MATAYNPSDWYWIVSDDQTKVYSSKVGDYILVSEANYQAWLKLGNLPTRIANADELAEVLNTARVRPVNVDLLDRYKASQASQLTMELVAKVLFNHENRLRALEGKTTITANQFANALKAML